MTDASPADEATFVPRSLGPYTIERELGAGAMGTVFRAIHIGLDRPVALKVLRPDALQDPDAVRRFLREGKNIARLEHPHIVAVYDAGEIAGIYYLAMKLLEGETLQSLLAHSGPLTTDRVVRLASQLAAALHYAHGRGVIHRDVKPANVIVAENDQATLTDFGIAQAINAGTARSMTIAGTPLYMSPEMIRGEDADSRSDIYSLGAVLYELCTGQPPFTGQMVSVMYAHINTPIPDIRSAAPSLPESLAQVIERMLAKSPAERYQSAGEIVQALARYGGEGVYNPGATFDASAPPSAGETALIEPDMASLVPPAALPETAARPEPAARRFRPIWLAVPAAVLAVVVAVGAFFLLQPSPSTGTAVVSSSPSGARLAVDGAPRGQTPLTLKDLQKGSHSLSVSYPTYQARTLDLTVSGGKTADMRVTLIPVAASNLVTAPQAILTTSYSTDPTTRRIVAGPPVTSIPTSQAVGKTLYVLAQYQTPTSVTSIRNVAFRPGFSLYDPNNFPIVTSPSPPTITLSRPHPAQVWTSGFRMRLVGHRSPPLGRYQLRITVDGKRVKTLSFSLTR